MFNVYLLAGYKRKEEIKNECVLIGRELHKHIPSFTFHRDRSI